MKIDYVHIKGFRNFVDQTISFDNKTLIVGGNDTGKTNLLYSLRILFDPSLSSRDLELDLSDFNVQSSPDEIVIETRLVDVTEKCLLSIFKDAVMDGVVYIRYRLPRDGEYELYTGPKKDALEPCQSRSYIRALTLEYVGGSRDLGSFLRRQQDRLLSISKGQRDDDETDADNAALLKIQESLTSLNDEISDLHYVKESLAAVNDEMEKLSSGNSGYRAKFVASNTDAGKLLDNLRLMYLSGDAPLSFGGEGRGNQLYFATWLCEQRLPRNQEHVTIYAIEEPEAHLHPHQQRLLADYLSSSLDEQVLITTHSPQVAEHFSGGRILRLSDSIDDDGTHAHGCGQDVDDALRKLGYRLNSISSEAFFCSSVFLVEGPSERIFYQAVCDSLGFSLDKSNISVLSVDGIGFEPYVLVCKALGIPFVLRTDNDVFKVPNTGAFHLAGIERGIRLAKDCSVDVDGFMEGNGISAETLSWNGPDEKVPQAACDAAESIRKFLKSYGIYLADVDLETDLANGPLADELSKYYGISSPADIDGLVRTMKHRKAENMHRFVRSNPEYFKLYSDSILEPVYYLYNLPSTRDADEPDS